jgi:hypothetical protein
MRHEFEGVLNIRRSLSLLCPALPFFWYRKANLVFHISCTRQNLRCDYAVKNGAKTRGKSRQLKIVNNEDIDVNVEQNGEVVEVMRSLMAIDLAR